ncbi:hypothetical protein HAX54_004675 [Datura stramonium]|uniref:Uncharacterized protein n=1 Tax=Datura stramonium TaxID=4076 RepID=A0ABS8RVB3_DATST|nr:hypothetical protein [Datura stramonium]MCE3216068.1 hypothetical protein [Datura stramonium]
MEEEKPRKLFLGELNLVLILSFLSLSSEEQNYEELEIHNDKDHQSHNNLVSKLNSRKLRGGMNQYRTTVPEMHRFHTKIKDSRHCRRM